MRRLKRVRDLFCVVQRRPDRQRALEQFALDQLHHQGALFDPVNLRDVGMVQRSQHLGFALEAGETLGV